MDANSNARGDAGIGTSDFAVAVEDAAELHTELLGNALRDPIASVPSLASGELLI